MARIVKEHAVRRKEILDAALMFTYTRGYEQMSIQDILNELNIAKGTFYHYFGSKQILLEALIERLLEEAEQVIAPIVNDPHLSALEKFQQYFSTLGRWKTTKKTFLLSLLGVWYADDNALMRQKMQAAGIKRVAPLLITIIQQGIREGFLTTPFPDQSGEIVFAIALSLSDTIAGLLLSSRPGNDPLPQIEEAVAAYTDALERVLGAPSGSFHLVDTEILKEWIVSPEGNS
jgi:AcrR family transcriptional regulator